MRFDFKSFIIAFFLFLGCFTLFAQEDEQKKNMVYFEPTSLLVPPNRLSIGYTRNIDENFFVGIEIGKSLDKNYGRSNERSYDYNLFAYRLEGGYIFNPQDRVNYYVSVDFQQIKHTEILLDDYFKSAIQNEMGNDVYYQFDEIDYRRRKTTLNFNYGFIAYFNKSRKFGINPSFGLGVKFVDVDFKNPKNINERDRPSGFLNFGSRYRMEGEVTTLNINLQLRLFFKF